MSQKGKSEMGSNSRRVPVLKRSEMMAQTYDRESELGENHHLGLPGSRYRQNSDLNFDDGLRSARDILLKNEQAEEPDETKEITQSVSTRVDSSEPEEVSKVVAQDNRNETEDESDGVVVTNESDVQTGGESYFEFPSVLTWEAVKKAELPENGSGLPKSLESDVPPQFRFWKCANVEDALAVREALVESGLFSPSTVGIVNGEPRRAVVETVQKLFLPPDYDDAQSVVVPPKRSVIEKAKSLLDTVETVAVFPHEITKSLGVSVILEKLNDVKTPWIVSVEDTQEIRKTLGRAFKLKSDDSNLFVSNVELVSNELVEWVHESRSEELVKYAFTKSQGIRIFKADKNEEERITFGVVLEPEEIDAQKDTVSIEEIEQAAYRFMEDFGNLGLQHSEIINGRTVLLESYIAPVDFEVGTEKVKAGSWLMKLRIVDEDLWEEIKSGAITGYSIGGSAIRKPV